MPSVVSIVLINHLQLEVENPYHPLSLLVCEENGILYVGLQLIDLFFLLQHDGYRLIRIDARQLEVPDRNFPAPSVIIIKDDPVRAPNRHDSIVGAGPC